MEECHGAADLVECRHIRQRIDRSLHIPVHIAGFKLDALIDTGATNSFIQSRLVARLGLTEHVQSTSVRVRLADGSVHPLAGRINVPMEIGGQKLQLDAYMIDGKGPSLVLGHPLFFHQGWLIDLRNKRLLELTGELVAKGEDKTKEDEGEFRADAGSSSSQ